ncbi:MAG: hypothetical protein Q9226_007967 [Calogaya cf. arnoldii]
MADGGYSWPLADEIPTLALPKLTIKHREVVVESDLPSDQEHLVTKTVVLWNWSFAFFYHRIDDENKHVVRTESEGKTGKKCTEIEYVKEYCAGNIEVDSSTSYRFQLEAFVAKIRQKSGSGSGPRIWFDGEDSTTQMQMIDTAYTKAGLPHWNMFIFRIQDAPMKMVKYIDNKYFPASAPSGHPKIIDPKTIDVGGEPSTMKARFNVLDAIATFLCGSRRLSVFLDINTYKFVDIQRVNKVTGRLSLHIERRQRCVTVCPDIATSTRPKKAIDVLTVSQCWSSEKGILPDDPVNNFLMFSIWEDGSWKLNYAHSSMDPPDDERTRIRNICKAFADGIMLERKWEERDHRLLVRVEKGDGDGDGEGTAASGG